MTFTDRSLYGRLYIASVTVSMLSTTAETVLLIYIFSTLNGTSTNRGTSLDSSIAITAIVAMLPLIFLVATMVVMWRSDGLRVQAQASSLRRTRSILLACLVLTCGGDGLAMAVWIMGWVSFGAHRPAAAPLAGGPFLAVLLLLIFWVLSITSKAINFLMISRRASRDKAEVAGLAYQNAVPRTLPKTTLGPEDPEKNIPKPSREGTPSRPSTSNNNNPFSSIHAASPPVTPKAGSTISLQSLPVPARAANSRTKLVRGRSESPEIASLTTTPRQSTESAFDAWDTSCVSHYMRENIHATQPSSARTRLPPIPGSRPVSPARPLNGPFPESDKSDVMPEGDPGAEMLPASPTLLCHPSEYPSASSDVFFSAPNSRPQSRSRKNSYSRPTSPFPLSPPIPSLFHSHSSSSLVSNGSVLAQRPPLARRLSASSHISTESFQHLRSKMSPLASPDPEEHIHPLFRSSSPCPAPATTPGTTVTAAPADLVELPAGAIREKVRMMKSPSFSGSFAGGSAPRSPLAEPENWGTFNGDGDGMVGAGSWPVGKVSFTNSRPGTSSGTPERDREEGNCGLRGLGLGIVPESPERKT